MYKEQIKNTIQMIMDKIITGTLIDTDLLYLLELLDLFLSINDAIDNKTLNDVMTERDKIKAQVNYALLHGTFLTSGTKH